MSLAAANQASETGAYPSINGQVLIHTSGFLKTREDVKSVVVGVHEQKPVYLRDVAEVIDGPEEPTQYVFFGPGPAAEEKTHFQPILSKRGVFWRYAHRSQTKRVQCRYSGQ